MATTVKITGVRAVMLGEGGFCHGEKSQLVKHNLSKNPKNPKNSVLLPELTRTKTEQKLTGVKPLTLKTPPL